MEPNGQRRISRTTWWGCQFFDGAVELYRFAPTEQALADARGNPLIVHIVDPFLADNEERALEELKKKLSLKARDRK